jgi:hypothetical protein
MARIGAQSLRSSVVHCWAVSLVALCLASAARAHAQPAAAEVLAEAHALSDQLVSWRRELHQIPELFFQEYNTSAYVQRELSQLGIPFTVVAGTGIRAAIGEVGAEGVLSVGFQAQNSAHVTAIDDVSRRITPMASTSPARRGRGKLHQNHRAEGGHGRKAALRGRPARRRSFFIPDLTQHGWATYVRPQAHPDAVHRGHREFCARSRQDQGEPAFSLPSSRSSLITSGPLRQKKPDMAELRRSDRKRSQTQFFEATETRGGKTKESQV